MSKLSGSFIPPTERSSSLDGAIKFALPSRLMIGVSVATFFGFVTYKYVPSAIWLQGCAAAVGFLLGFFASRVVLTSVSMSSWPVLW